MKIALISYLLLTVNLSWAGGVPTKVCHEEKKKQVCKTVLVHKKLDVVK